MEDTVKGEFDLQVSIADGTDEESSIDAPIALRILGVGRRIRAQIAIGAPARRVQKAPDNHWRHRAQAYPAPFGRHCARPRDGYCGAGRKVKIKGRGIEFEGNRRYCRNFLQRSKKGRK